MYITGCFIIFVVLNHEITLEEDQLAVYDFKYLRGLPFGLFEFEDPKPDWILLLPYISLTSQILRGIDSHVGYKILRSHSPEEFCIALTIGLLLKSNTELAVLQVGMT